MRRAVRGVRRTGPPRRQKSPEVPTRIKSMPPTGTPSAVTILFRARGVVDAMGTPRTLDARASVAWSRRFARTTPGVVGIIAVVVAACCVIAGVVSGAATQRPDRRAQRRFSTVPSRSPTPRRTCTPHLSAADAAAATAYLSGGIETPQHAGAVSASAGGRRIGTGGCHRGRHRCRHPQGGGGDIGATGRLHGAGRVGAGQQSAGASPIGSAYLREASSLMQTHAASRRREDLHRQPRRASTRTSARVGSTADRQPRAAGARPGGDLRRLGDLLSRRTNRQFNIGLVVAAAVVLLVIGWIVVATRLAASAIEDSRTEGTARFEQLAKARILAQQARTDETLQLIARGDITAGEKSFNGRIDDLTARLGTGLVRRGGRRREMDCQPPQAGGGLPRRRLPGRGRRRRSAPIPALRPRSSPSSNPACATRSSRPAPRCATGCPTAGTWLAWSPTGTLVLMVVAAAAAVVGLWPRLKEFL